MALECKGVLFAVRSRKSPKSNRLEKLRRAVQKNKSSAEVKVERTVLKGEDCCRAWRRVSICG